MVELIAVLLLGVIQPLNTTAQDFPEVLDLSRAMQIFRERGFDSLVADAALEGAAAQTQLAGQVSNPVVGGSLGKSFNVDTSSPGFSDLAKGLQLSDQGALGDIVLGKRQARVAVAQAAVAAARQDRLDAQRTLESVLKQTFLQAVIAHEALQFSRLAQAAFAHTAELFGVRYAAGAVSETDLARVETAALEAEQQVDQAVAAEREVKLLLAFFLGTRGNLPAFTVQSTWLDDEKITHIADLSPEALLTMARQQRPDLAAARFQKERAERTLDLAYHMRVPDVALQLAYSEEGRGNNAISPQTLTLGLNLTLPVFNQYQGEIQQAIADVRLQDLQHDRIDAKVAADVGTAHADFLSAQSRLQRMRSRLRARAARALQLVQIQYEKGAASLLDLLDAQRTNIAINLEYFDDLKDYWTAIFQLEEAVAAEFGS